MRFKTEKDVEIRTKLHSNQKSEEEMKNYIVHQTINNEIVINAKVPEAGDYALDLYAKEKGQKGLLSHVCSYLVRSENAAFDPTPYAASANGTLGTRDGDVKVIPKSHPSALIEAPETGDLEITMTTPVPCDLLTKLELHTENGPQEKENYTFIHKSEDEVKILGRLPEPGNYVLNIYGKEAGKDGTFPLIYTYAIEANFPTENSLPFPKSFSDWKTGCELLKPINGILPSNQSVAVSVKVPGAAKVAMIGSEWTHLEKDDDGIWYGNVPTEQAGIELKLGAAFDESTNSYPTLLQFEVSKNTKITTSA